MLQSAVEMLGRLLQYADSIQVSFIDAVLPLLIHRMQDLSHTAVLQNGCEALRAFIKAGKESLLQWYLYP